MMLENMKKIVVSLVIVLSTITAATAQTAEEIIAKSIEARGGAAKLNALKSMRMENVISVMGMEIPSTSVIVHKRGMRNETEVMGQKIVVGVDGNKGWMVNPMTGSTTPIPLPDDQLKNSMSQMDLSGMANYKEAGATVELLGKEAVDGNDAYKIKMTTKEGGVSTYFISAKNFYPIRMDMSGEVNGQAFSAQTTMSDYRVIDGIAFPFLMEVNSPQGAVVVNTKKLEVNPTVDESIFVQPKN